MTLLRGQLGMGAAFNQKSYPVAASQTIRKGDLLAKTSGANTVEQAIAAPAAGNATVSGGNLPILGVALEDVTTNASGVETFTGKSTVAVAILDANLELGLRFLGVTATGAVTVSSVASASELQDLALFGAYQFARYTPASGNPFYVLVAATTNGELIYVAPHLGCAADDDFGVAWCRAAVSETVRLG